MQALQWLAQGKAHLSVVLLRRAMIFQALHQLTNLSLSFLQFVALLSLYCMVKIAGKVSSILYYKVPEHRSLQMSVKMKRSGNEHSHSSIKWLDQPGEEQNRSVLQTIPQMQAAASSNRGLEHTAVDQSSKQKWFMIPF